MKIMLVEDDPVTLVLCETFLKGLGHDVTSVADGEKAWLSLTTGEYHLIISDWNLPGTSGTDLCERLRARPSQEYPYFILITTYQGREKVDEAMNAGVDDFLTKPVDLANLAIRLRVAERIRDFHRQIGVLHRLLPICMYCKKIRGDKEYWENVDSFFAAHLGADFTHSLCPDCYLEKVKPEIDDLREGGIQGSGM
ncbi:MAG: response regulator receiver protein [Fibrobacteres bacterium]|nr:response regulator receiver protein [Fibrobacterota bacterium]